MLKSLINIANTLDNDGLVREASELDKIITKLASSHSGQLNIFDYIDSKSKAEIDIKRNRILELKRQMKDNRHDREWCNELQQTIDDLLLEIEKLEQ